MDTFRPAPVRVTPPLKRRLQENRRKQSGAQRDFGSEEAGTDTVYSVFRRNLCKSFSAYKWPPRARRTNKERTASNAIGLPNLVRNTSKDQEGKPIKWLKIKCLWFEKVLLSSAIHTTALAPNSTYSRKKGDSAT
ncbi:hypothetical protein MSG28_014456 [Choristoneura fumiferana]|uniref:Uncharacterized protein n=1 Tax=Choristoneura fumiferana TaxID=7141 RepID=A0ACC0JRN0_CHOFU|nr:hypothetical protein MSG28_014456 [Choristoneura fumiferana]